MWPEGRYVDGNVGRGGGGGGGGPGVTVGKSLPHATAANTSPAVKNRLDTAGLERMPTPDQ
jgi:hypothetical protein